MCMSSFFLSADALAALCSSLIIIQHAYPFLFRRIHSRDEWETTRWESSHSSFTSRKFNSPRKQPTQLPSAYDFFSRLREPDGHARSTNGDRCRSSYERRPQCPSSLYFNVTYSDSHRHHSTSISRLYPSPKPVAGSTRKWPCGANMYTFASNLQEAVEEALRPISQQEMKIVTDRELLLSLYKEWLK